MPAVTRRARRLALTGLLAIGAAGAALPSAESEDQPRAETRPGVGTQPNVVVVMTDDQTVESMRVMDTVDRLLVDRGVTFTNSFVSNPVCCPSRATFLTGRYSHNNGVYRNGPPHGGYPALPRSHTLPRRLQRAGYHTAHIGKYLNGYGLISPPAEIPPGWTDWYGLIDPTYSMYGYTLNENGRLVTHGSPEVEDPAVYQTDVFAAKGAALIARLAPRAKPFFLSVAPLAPHYEHDLDNLPAPRPLPNPRPAPRHAGAFADEALPRPPSYDEADVSDKPEEIRGKTPFPPAVLENQTARYRGRLASLLAVDDLVEELIAALRDAHELGNTLIIFTSDNGYLLGEHRIRENKQYVYEESIRVPLVIRGPGVPAGKRRSAPAANVDLAPTILEYAGAGAGAGLELDGRSLSRLIAEPRFEPGRAIVLENWCQRSESCFDATTPRYRAVRTQRYVYAEYPNGENELYDLATDPFQLTSRHQDSAYAERRRALADLLGELSACAGGGCRARPELRLKLRFTPGERRGRRCARSSVTARITGGDRRAAEQAEFFLGTRRAGADLEAPLRMRIARKRLRTGRGRAVTANVTVLDGRIRTERAKAPRRC